jgi:hypothetical protein
MTPRPPILTLALGLVACAQRDPASAAGDGLCTALGSSDAAVFCHLDHASELALAGRDDQARATCEGLDRSAWRRECHYRLAELAAHQGRVAEAFERCGLTGGALQLCLTHSAWIGSEHLVDSAPSDPAAQAAVDALADLLPPRPEAIPERKWKVEGNVRAAAWHGIYAGSGDSDPTAARSARDKDADKARGGFTWELVRLMGPQLGARTLANTASWVWRGELPAPRGAPLAQPCWPARILYRANDASSYGVPTTKHFLNGKRVSSDDPEADLLIGVVEATWGQGTELEPEEVELLLGHPDQAVRRTAAKFAGLLPEAFPDPLAVVDTDDEYAVGIATDTRAALLAQERPRTIEYPLAEACP